MTCIKNVTRGCCFSTNDEGEATANNCPGCHKLEVFDWIADLPNPLAEEQIFEIQFKNTRKGYYQNSANLPLKIGDIVAVEASPGHDIGIVTLSGDLVTRQMKKSGFNTQGLEFKKIYRKAKPYDIEKWQEAIALEHSTMIRSRQISSDLGLNMKIGDVEYQGDRLKAIFYYIADERVDFRELIKVLADQFKIRVEMRQIGARQEAGRIGGIAACGRELCCSTWLGNFSSVTIGAARHQEISLNPQKLAGQCGKLKCCLNYELDTYIDARRSFPRVQAPLEAIDGSYHLVKSDIFRRKMWFSPDPNSTAIMIMLDVERVKKIMAMNRRGEKIDTLEDKSVVVAPVVVEPQFENVVGQDSLTRFDPNRPSSRGRSGRSRQGRNGGSEGRSTENRTEKAGENRSDKGRSEQRSEGRNRSGGRSARPEQQGLEQASERQGANQRPGSRQESGQPSKKTASPEVIASDSPERAQRGERNNHRSRNGSRHGRSQEPRAEGGNNPQRENREGQNREGQNRENNNRRHNNGAADKQE